MWTQLPPEKRHTHPYPILAHAYCGQMAGRTKTPLGTCGHIVLDGVSAPAKGAQQPPSFRPMSIVATVSYLSYSWAFVPIKTANIIKQNWNQFLLVVKATALKRQISKFSPQILSTEAIFYIILWQATWLT